MSQSIIIELRFFAISILWGALVLLAYDQLRVLRRIIRHNSFWIAVQDLIFWIFASVFIFAMIYVNNSGIIRGFSVMGIVIGMIVYHFLLSDLVVTLISRGILFLLYPVSIVLKYIKKVLNLIIKKCGKYTYRIFMQLKKLVKSVKINFIKHKESTSKKRENKKRKKQGKIRKEAKKETKKKVKKKAKKAKEIVNRQN